MKSHSRVITLWILDYNFAEKSHVKWPSSRTNNQSQSGFDWVFLFLQECSYYIFLKRGYCQSKVTTQSTISTSVKLDLKYIFSEASLVIKTPLYDSSIFQRKETIVTRPFQHMQSICTQWVHTVGVFFGQKKFSLAVPAEDPHNLRLSSSCTGEGEMGSRILESLWESKGYKGIRSCITQYQLADASSWDGKLSLQSR